MPDIRITGPLNHAVALSLIGPEYTVTKTTGADVCKGPRGTPAVIFSRTLMARRTLSLIVCTRSHIKGRLDQVKYSEDEDAPMPRFQSIPRRLVERLKERHQLPALELDITAAWWTAALHVGALDPAFYRKIMNNAEKADRLKAIGSLATFRTRQVYRNGIAVGEPEHGYSSPELSRVFRAIVEEADRAIKILADAAGNDFLFYWADALFIEPNNRTRRELEKMANALGYTLHGLKKIYKLKTMSNPYTQTPAISVGYRKEEPRLFCLAPESDGRDEFGIMREE